MNRTVLALFLIILVGGFQCWSDREESHPPGILVTELPQQKELPQKLPPIPYKTVLLDPLAEYSMRARVLSTERYWIDRLSRIVPVDVALGWGVMSDTRVLEDLKISQNGRFYFYSWRDPAPVNPREIVASSANMHLIPSTPYIEQEIKRLRKGQVVKLDGYLVKVNFADGSEAKSSMAREDSGAGACEIMWVRNLEVQPEI